MRSESTILAAAAVLAIAAGCGSGVPILMYHSVSANGDPLTTAPVEFGKHLDYLAAAGYSTITLQQMLDARSGGPGLPARPIVLTFDDGYEDAYTDVLPNLVARGQRATFFIISGMTAADEQHRASTGTGPSLRRYLTWPEVAALQKTGMEIGSHTISHRNLSRMDDSQLAREVQGSKNALEDGLHAKIEFFSYPFTYHDTRAQAAVASAGYRGAVAGPHGNNDAFTLQRFTITRGMTVEDLRGLLATWAETAYTAGQ